LAQVSDRLFFYLPLHVTSELTVLWSHAF